MRATNDLSYFRRMYYHYRQKRESIDKLLDPSDDEVISKAIRYQTLELRFGEIYREMLQNIQRQCHTLQ